MFELLRLVDFAERKLADNKELVMATIVKTTGSSYRKIWTQMMIADDFTFAGALSGGCVEKEVLRQCKTVFTTGKKVLFTYDGQYRLGCKGVIYILLEKLENSTAPEWIQHIHSFAKKRQPFQQGLCIDTQNEFSTFYLFGQNRISFSQLANTQADEQQRSIRPQRQLIIIGSEHDSAQLALIAAHSGFLVNRVVGKSFPIPENQDLYHTISLPPEAITQQLNLDSQTALVLMTHTLSTDFTYLQHILPHKLTYLGVLGPPQRKEELLNNFVEQNPEQSFEYIDQIENIYGPIGFNIGGRTPEEIAVSVLAEIVAVFNGKITQVNKRLQTI